MTAINWPDGFPRTDPDDRERTHKFEATRGQTTKDLLTELERMDVDDFAVSFGNNHTRADGFPRNNARPDDPGFVLRWTADGEQFAVACDGYTSLDANMREVYLWVKETRMRSNRLVTTGESEFAAARLPSGEEAAGDGEEPSLADRVRSGDVAAHKLLAVQPDAPDSLIKHAYREKTKDVHPDRGGDLETFQAVKAAKEVLLDGD